jgi:hypothetical protein
MRSLELSPFVAVLLVSVLAGGCNAGASFALPETADGGAVTSSGNTLDGGALTATGAVAAERRHAIAAERALAPEPKQTTPQESAEEFEP